MGVNYYSASVIYDLYRFLSTLKPDAVRILRSCDQVVVLELTYQPDKFQELQSEIWKIREENKRKVLQCDSIKL